MGSGLGPLLVESSDHGYAWYAKSRGADGGFVPPQKVISMPECAHYRDDVNVPGKSADRAVPTAGCLSRGPSARDALKGGVGRGCDEKVLVVKQEIDVHKTNVEDWTPYKPTPSWRYKFQVCSGASVRCKITPRP